jgi:FHA domain/zinc-ribbon domain
VTCAYCGAELIPGALFCGQCGHSVSDEPDLEPTLIVESSHAGEKFVLQFSTGESITVYGTGLIGRHPVAEPGEYFDQTVTIVDPSKSVSKTHLEFGQTSGAFWVSDRHSGNGTIVREPDSEPRRCDAGKRYRIVRGTRVAIGEQFFVIS